MAEDKSVLYHPEVDKQEHEDTKAPPTKRVLVYGWNADTLKKIRLATDDDGHPQVDIKTMPDISVTAASYALQFDTDSGTSTTYYVGEAAAGSGTDEVEWRIFRVQTASGVQIDWADGDTSFNNIWDNREALSYS